MTKKTEQTNRELYAVLDSIRRARKHPNLTARFEAALEEHLEALRQENVRGITALSSMIEERDQIQNRLHAVDHALFNLDKANKIAGEELARAQTAARENLEDCRRAEKLSDSLDESLRDAKQVIAHQELLIVSQRLAIADLYMKAMAVPRASR